MPFPLVEVPRGMTSALGVRQQGDLPSFLADFVQGTVDFTAPYLFGRREFVSQAGIAANTGAGTVTVMPSLVVPPGEAWYVWAWQVSCTTAAGEALSFGPALRLTGGTITVAPILAVPASTTTWVVPYAGAVWLAPGEGLGCVTSSATGAPQVAGAASITRLRV